MFDMENMTFVLLAVSDRYIAFTEKLLIYRFRITLNDNDQVLFILSRRKVNQPTGQKILPKNTRTNNIKLIYIKSHLS
jgi:hypothetical protein